MKGKIMKKYYKRKTKQRILKIMVKTTKKLSFSKKYVIKKAEC